MKQGKICVGMVGSGRAAELHMQAYGYVRGIEIFPKKITALHMERALEGKNRFGFAEAVDSFGKLLEDEEIDVIDICSPPYTHVDMIYRALMAGKYVICEKPLTGYFGMEQDRKPIGKCVSRKKMYENVLHDMECLQKVMEKHPGHFMYAENYIYAPTIQKMAEIISQKKSRILCMKGEESLKGSSSKVAGKWDKTGGGTFIRTGSHPLSAILWLKQIEAATYQKEIHVESLVADMELITPQLTEYEHRHIAAEPLDVEDFGSVTMTFSDKTKAVVMATDTLLGGSRNYVEAYCNDAVLYANLTLTNQMSTYFLDEDRLDNVQISEMLPTKVGWNHPFIADEIMRGYVGEMQDFMECIIKRKNPLSDFQLAYDTTKVIYAAYQSAEEGRRIYL